jgi:hypothetical protein
MAYYPDDMTWDEVETEMARLIFQINILVSSDKKKRQIEK